MQLLVDIQFKLDQSDHARMSPGQVVGINLPGESSINYLGRFFFPFSGLKHFPPINNRVVHWKMKMTDLLRKKEKSLKMETGEFSLLVSTERENVLFI